MQSAKQPTFSKKHLGKEQISYRKTSLKTLVFTYLNVFITAGKH
jgi:hypothetical protein